MGNNGNVIWGLIGVLLLIVALVWRLRLLTSWWPLTSRRRRAAVTFPAVTGDRLDPAETASIAATLESIGLAHADAQNRRLTMLVGQLIDRQVPVRLIEVIPGHAEARVRFADGTTVRARGTAEGDLGLLAAVIRDGSVTPMKCTTDVHGVHIVFDRSARQVIGGPRRLSIRVIGIDQPD